MCSSCSVKKPRDLFKTQHDISKSFLWHKLPIVPGRGLYVNKKKKKRCLKAFVKEACERAFTFFFKLPFRFPEIQTLSWRARPKSTKLFEKVRQFHEFQWFLHEIARSIEPQPAFTFPGATVTRIPASRNKVRERSVLFNDFFTKCSKKCDSSMNSNDFCMKLREASSRKPKMIDASTKVDDSSTNSIENIDFEATSAAEGCALSFLETGVCSSGTNSLKLYRSWIQG